MYFLDTNICIYFLKGMFPNLLKTLLSTHPSKIKIPAIVKAELLYGAYKSNKKIETIQKIEEFLQPFKIIEFDDNSTYFYSEIRTKLEKKGNIIGPNDILIASIVLANNGILITNNTKEFKRIENLRLSNWI